VALGLALFGAGVLTGVVAIGRRQPPAAPAPPVLAACPPAPACPPVGSRETPARRPAVAAQSSRRARAPHAEPAQPLPERQPLDEETRKQALHAFAEQKAPELRDCVPEPDRGPPLKLGAAFEIDPKGSVDSVQILGADGSPKEVRRCYAKHLKHWRFPEELLRGDEKLLVNFIL
jgi:hypothetical protein